MKCSMIDGVSVHPLQQICDERGKVMHMLRADDQCFQRFGEIYFSVVYPGAIKGWHLHAKMTLNYAVPYGHIKLVCYDDRDRSRTKGALTEIYLGEDSYNLVIIQPGIWNGFKGLGTTVSIVANCATMPHHPDEVTRKSPFSDDIPYNWDIQHG